MVPTQNGAIPVEAPPPQCAHQLLDADEFRGHGHQVIDFIADYYARVGDYPVRPSVTPGFHRRQFPADAPCRPEPDAFAAALQDVRDLILPGMTHWQSPRHFAHFPASSSTVGALGEALTAGIDVVPFTWAASPAATELEMVVVDVGNNQVVARKLVFRKSEDWAQRKKLQQCSSLEVAVKKESRSAFP